jgi:hypothetical protein
MRIEGFSNGILFTFGIMIMDALLEEGQGSRGNCLTV